MAVMEVYLPSCVVCIRALIRLLKLGEISGIADPSTIVDPPILWEGSRSTTKMIEPSRAAINLSSG